VGGGGWGGAWGGGGVVKAGGCCWVGLGPTAAVPAPPPDMRQVWKAVSKPATKARRWSSNAAVGGVTVSERKGRRR